jgi:uncharacterized protein involved in type VI secretion and phage assembly
MSKRGGVVTAFVEEVDAKQGRIKVEYRSMQDRLLSSWAYMATPMTGKGRGQLFMPEKGDEVLICYGDGDFGHPYVVGFLWNGEQTSPEKTPDNRVIVTPGNHQLRFHDKKNERKVVLRSDGERELLLDDKPGAGKVQITSGEHRVLMDDAPAGTKIEIKAGKAIGVTITLNVTPQPSLAIQVGAGNTINVSDTGVTMTAAGSLAITTGAAATVTVGGAASVSVAGAASITAGGAVNVTAGGAVNLTAGALNVTSGIANFAGVVTASAIVTNSVVSPLYTPGLGNLV